MELGDPDSVLPTGTAASLAALPSPGNSETPAPVGNSSICVRVAFKPLIWGPCKLHVLEAPATTTIGDIVSLAARHRHSHLLPIFRLLLAIFVDTTIEETRFSQVRWLRSHLPPPHPPLKKPPPVTLEPGPLTWGSLLNSL